MSILRSSRLFRSILRRVTVDMTIVAKINRSICDVSCSTVEVGALMLTIYCDITADFCHSMSEAICRFRCTRGQMVLRILIDVAAIFVWITIDRWSFRLMLLLQQGLCLINR